MWYLIVITCFAFPTQNLRWSKDINFPPKGWKWRIIYYNNTIFSHLKYSCYSYLWSFICICSLKKKNNKNLHYQFIIIILLIIILIKYNITIDYFYKILFFCNKLINNIHTIFNTSKELERGSYWFFLIVLNHKCVLLKYKRVKVSDRYSNRWLVDLGGLFISHSFRNCEI